MNVDVLPHRHGALFRAVSAKPEVFARILEDFGERIDVASYVVPSEAAIATVERLLREGVRVTAEKSFQGFLKSRAFHADDGRLYPYQRKGAEFLRARRRALLADDMGVGKTCQALASISTTLGALVVCPPVMVGTWVDEARKWRRDLTPRIHRPPYAIFPDPGEVIVTSYSRLPGEHEVIKSCFDVTKQHPTHWEVRHASNYALPRWIGAKPKSDFHLIVDEAHYCKSPGARRTVVVRAIAAMAKKISLLTGTPLLNRPPELWAILQSAGWAASDVFGSWSEFVELFNGKKKHFGGYEWGEPSVEAKRRLSMFMLRRTREEVLPDLPPTTTRVVRVDVAGPPLKTNLDAMTDDQVLEGCAPEGILSSARRELAALKVKTALALADEHEANDQKLIVFSAHRAPVLAFAEREGWAVILGDTPDRERSLLVKAFQNGSLKGIAGTIGAMGVGVTLTAAHHMLFVDRSYVPAENLQAQARFDRIGQKAKGLFVTRLECDHPVDRRVAEVLAKKEEMLEGMGL